MFSKDRQIPFRGRENIAETGVAPLIINSFFFISWGKSLLIVSHFVSQLFHGTSLKVKYIQVLSNDVNYDKLGLKILKISLNLKNNIDIFTICNPTNETNTQNCL